MVKHIFRPKPRGFVIFLCHNQIASIVNDHASFSGFLGKNFSTNNMPLHNLFYFPSFIDIINSGQIQHCSKIQNLMFINWSYYNNKQRKKNYFRVHSIQFNSNTLFIPSGKFNMTCVKEKLCTINMKWNSNTCKSYIIRHTNVHFQT